jgi:hypothetical protein
VEWHLECNILYLSKEGLEKIAEKVNPFWKDFFFNLSELKQEKGGNLI